MSFSLVMWINSTTPSLWSTAIDRSRSLGVIATTGPWVEVILCERTSIISSAVEPVLSFATWNDQIEPFSNPKSIVCPPRSMLAVVIW